MTCAQNSRFDLGSVLGLPVAVFLNDDKRDRFHFLVSGEPLIALIADTPPSNGIIVFGRPAVDHPGIFMTAKRAFHPGYPPLYRYFVSGGT